ncbi:XRE family transcriptional regulator [Bombilactobacillus bombi]|uniref:XRE family transcriptional regulator n=1 Tax=Bombilactobacillus bombi TaxID=1303590 RepID=A0A3R6ZV21_9LACO|nr:helix-turn-helix transcriptional regulator [Bombilactobacillus bombi]RHW46787.1 XRE family transcriptional regulator [Bombilactobacillus bombi]
MNKLYIRIKDLANQKHVSFAQIERDLDFSNGILSSWKTSKATSDKLIKVANYFDVSTDYLLGITDNKYSLSDKEKKDVGVKVQELLEGMNTEGSVNFFGEPMSEEDKIAIESALKTAVAMNKERAKKRRAKKEQN